MTEWPSDGVYAHIQVAAMCGAIAVAGCESGSKQAVPMPRPAEDLQKEDFKLRHYRHVRLFQVLAFSVCFS